MAEAVKVIKAPGLREEMRRERENREIWKDFIRKHVEIKKLIEPHIAPVHRDIVQFQAVKSNG